MASQEQIEANRLNATHSTGPRTEAGRESSAKNHLTHGLFTRQDYVKPDERDFYKEFCEDFYAELSPVGNVESSLAAQIVGASWRLHRCSNVEGDIADYAPKDPLLDALTEKARRSMDRARASAHSQFHRSLNQLRKVQTERAIRIARYGEDMPGLAECNKIEAARKKLPSAPADLALSELDLSDVDRLNKEILALLAARTQGQREAAPGTELASNCQAAPEALETPETEADEDAAFAEFALKLSTLDEAGQLPLLAERRRIDEAEREAILNAA